MSDDEIRDPIAAMDQALRGMKDLARALHAHYTELVAVGFTPDEALTLTIAFQTAGVNRRPDSEGS